MAEQPGEWVPAFEGQRPPFAPGNMPLNATHGAYSPRKVEPLARGFVEALLEDATVPAYAKAPAYRAELWATARAEAQVQLLTEFLMTAGEQSADGLGDLGDERIRAAYLLLHRAEGRAASGRTRLGLTPVSAARLGKHVAQGQAAVAQADVSRVMAELHRLEQAGRLPAGLAAQVEDELEDDEEGDGDE